MRQATRTNALESLTLYRTTKRSRPRQSKDQQSQTSDLRNIVNIKHITTYEWTKHKATSDQRPGPSYYKRRQAIVLSLRQSACAARKNYTMTLFLCMCVQALHPTLYTGPAPCIFNGDPPLANQDLTTLLSSIYKKATNLQPSRSQKASTRNKFEKVYANDGKFELTSASM